MNRSSQRRPFAKNWPSLRAPNVARKAATRRKPAFKSAAVVTVFEIPTMTKRGRKQTADWLRGRADLVEKHNSEDFSNRFTSRYMCEAPTTRARKR